jgi:site-specific recombinase XerD
VVRWELADLDWHHGEIVVRGKGDRQDRLPLPVDVGEAVVGYLVRRPRVDDRTVFLRVHAPVGAMSPSEPPPLQKPLYTLGVRPSVEVVSAHRLRHSAATAMLAGGASLAEIGQVLRHSRAATTAMYAKVDRAALRDLALPWPEVAL